MDAGIIDSDGFVHIMSRDDDVINVAGHRISTKALEEVSSKLYCLTPMLVVTTLSFVTGDAGPSGPPGVRSDRCTG